MHVVERLDSTNKQNAPTRVHMYTNTLAYINVYAYMFRDIHIYIYVHIHMHLYTHTCTHIFDGCCFYYFVRNSLVALLEALCARIFSFRSVNIGFCFWKKIYIYIYIYTYCVCVCKVSNKLFLPPLSSRLLCLVVSIPLVCWLYMCACVCVPLYVHVKMCSVHTHACAHVCTDRKS